MQFDDFIWKNPPQRWQVVWRKNGQEVRRPGGISLYPQMGDRGRLVKGEGFFYGSDAEADFLSLMGKFSAGKKTLILPDNTSFSAVMTELERIYDGAPGVSYRFTFCEAG